MDFVTLDMELADRILPSICSLSLISWENNKIVDTYSTLINPDCEIEEFFKDRHGMTNKMLENAPTIYQVWEEIRKRISGNIVFSHFANRNTHALITRAKVDYLSVPNHTYCCTASISKRTWKGLQDYKLPTITEALNINCIHNNSFHDAVSVGKIVYKSMEEYEVNDINKLFSSIGYAGGFVVDGERMVYRSNKDKKTGLYHAKVNIKDEEPYFLDKLV